MNVSIHVEWNPPVATASVPPPTSYAVQFDAQPPVSVPAPANSVPTTVIASPAFVITDMLAHQVSVVAVNQWGPGPAAVVPVAVLVPGLPTNLVVRVP